MRTLTFKVSGIPAAYSRTRIAFDPRTNKTRFIMANNEREWRGQVAANAALAARQQGWDHGGGPLELVLMVHRPIAPSVHRKVAAGLVGTPCMSRPDADNFLKSCLDALKQANVFDDDAHVWKATVEKRWCRAADAGVEVTVTC